MSHSVLDIFLLSLIDRGLCTKYDLQRRGGVSLGSSTPALKRLQKAGLITQHEAEQDSKRLRKMLELTAAGRRIARHGWREYFDAEVNLDLEAILRIVDVAGHHGAPRGAIIEFLDAMASQRSRLPAKTHHCTGESIIGFQEQLAACRVKADSTFLKNLASSLSRSRKSRTRTNQPRPKVSGPR